MTKLSKILAEAELKSDFSRNLFDECIALLNKDYTSKKVSDTKTHVVWEFMAELPVDYEEISVVMKRIGVFAMAFNSNGDVKSFLLGTPTTDIASSTKEAVKLLDSVLIGKNGWSKVDKDNIIIWRA